MSNNITHSNRRSFLKVSAAASGGMVLGFQLVGCKTEPKRPSFVQPVLEEPKIWNDLNGFISVGENGVVTIMSPNPEIGQNVKTSMPMIVAEELDVSWDNVIVEQAGLDTDKYQRQIAGGSQSIRFGWDGLRKAGATARHMLVAAAAVQLDVPASELTTSEGVIYHKASDRTIGYGEVATAAATMEVPEDVTLKEIKDYKIIGKNTRNVDGFKIATGQPLFGLDTQKPGMLIAMIEHAPAFGMKVKSVDDSQARSMPGIKDVFTINVEPDGVEKQWSDVNSFPQLVAIVGESTWQVMKAKKALKIEWEKDSEGESSTDHETSLTNLVAKASDEAARNDGNVDDAFANATQVIEKTYNAPFLAHNTMRDGR